MKKKKSNKNIYLVLFILFLSAAIGYGGFLLYKSKQKADADEYMTSLADSYTESVTPTATDTPTPTPEPTATPEPTETPEPTPEPVDPLAGVDVPEKAIDWEGLAAENPDIYAWIYIPNTNVDYPILQHPTEQSYYLDHNIDHSEGYPGCIYTHLRNNKNWSDPNTIIYGHNMRSGTMFASLHYYEDGEFFNNNPYVYIYTPDQGTLVYEIFAVRTGGDEDILGTYDFTDEETFRSYIYTLLNSRDMSGHIRNDVPVETTDHMITLSTCTGDSSTRLLVEAVLLNDENVPEYTFAKTN